MPFVENVNNEKLLREQADSAIAALKRIEENANNVKLMREQADLAVADLQPMSFVENANNEKLFREQADSAIAALKRVEENANNVKLMREQADFAVSDLQPMSFVEKANNEKLLRERADFAIAALKRIEEKLSNLLTNFINKDLPALQEKAVKKELASIATTVVHSLSPVIEKLISLLIQIDVDKAGARLESSVYSNLQVDKQVFLSKELNRLVLDRKFEEAFSFAFGTWDFAVVSWLCYQVDLQGILTLKPLPLSQNVLQMLLRMLSFDIQRDTTRKLSWMLDVMSAIIIDRTKALHIRILFEHVESCIISLSNRTSLSVPDKSLIRVMLHMIRRSVRAMCEGM